MRCDTLVVFKGPSSKGIEGNGKGMEKEGKRREKERKGRGQAPNILS